MRVRNFIALMAALTWFTTGQAQAQSADQHFKDKTLQVIVGYAPGGGFDQYARLVAEFLPRYLPGQPKAIVQNMPGASSITATRHILNVAPKDGTIIGIPNHNLFLEQVLGRGNVDFDMTAFNWLGRLGTRLSVGVVWKRAGVNNMKDARGREVILAGSGESGGTAFLPSVFNKVLGTNFRVVKGYRGQTEMYLALERGEADGMASAVWEDLKSGAQASWREKDLVSMLYVVSASRSPELPNVPSLPELAENAEDKAILDIMAAADTIGRAFYVAPGVPPEPVATLRAAFNRMLADPDLKQEAAKRNVEIAPLPGDELARFLKGVIGTPRPVVERLKGMIDAS